MVLKQYEKVNNDQVLTAILALVALIATSEIIEKSKKLDSIKDLLNQEMEKIKIKSGIKHKFTIAEDGFNYLSKKLNEPTFSVDHVAFAPPIPRWPKQNKTYKDSQYNLLKKNKVNYRYIGCFSPERERIDSIVEYLGDKSIMRYFPAYYQQSPESFPGFSFMVVDKKEVVAYYPGLPGDPETVIVFQDVDIIQMYSNYFMRLWSDAKKLDYKSALVVLDDAKSKRK